MIPRNHPDRIQIAFDDHRLVANAGLILPATLTLRLGLPQLLRKHLDLGDARPGEHRPCVAWLAPSSLNSTTNGPSAVDTSHPPFSPSMKLLQGPNPQKRLRLRQHQQDDALLHDLSCQSWSNAESR